MVIHSEDVIIKAVNHEIRREVLKLLKKEPMTYTELLTHFDISTGKLNYHLKLLHGLIEKTREDKYELSALGTRALDTFAKLNEGFTEVDQKLIKTAYNAQKHTRFPLVLSTIDFGIMALFIAMPTIIISYLLFTGGSGLAFLALFPSPNSLIYAIDGQMRFVNTLHRFSWETVFWFNIAGPLACSACLVIFWLVVLPRLKPEALYSRLFTLVLMVVLTALGPGSLVGWVGYISPASDITNPLKWYLQSQGISIDVDLIFNIVGIAIACLLMYRLFFYFRDVVGRLLDEFHPIMNGSTRSKRSMNLSTIAFMGLACGVLIGLASLGSYVLFANSWTTGLEWENLAYGCGLFGLLYGMWFFNKVHIHRKNAHFASKNFQSFMLGAILFLVTVTLPLLIAPYTPGGNAQFYSANHSQYWPDWHNGTQVGVISRGDDLYAIFQFNHYFSDSTTANFEGVGLARLDPATYQWSEPAYLLLNTTLRDEIVGSSFSGQLDFGYCFDTNNHLWLGYLKSPSPVALIENPNANLTLVVKGWDLPGTFDGQYLDPVATFQDPNINISVNYNASPTAWVRGQFDSTRNASWFTIASTGAFAPAGSKNPTLLLVNLNITSMSLGTPVTISGDAGPLHLNVLNFGDWQPMHFYANGTVEVMYGDYSEDGGFVTMVTRTQPGSDFLQTWSEPVTVFSGVPDKIRYEADRIVVVTDSQYDLWIQTFNTDWHPITNSLRVTRDYQEDYGYLYGNGTLYHFLIDATFYSADVSLANWVAVGNYIHPY